MSNLYDHLSRCLKVVDRNQGKPIDYLYNKAYVAKIPETKNWSIKDYFMKMVNDGMIYVSGKGLIYITPGGGQ